MSDDIEYEKIETLESYGEYLKECGANEGEVEEVLEEMKEKASKMNVKLEEDVFPLTVIPAEDLEKVERQ